MENNSCEILEVYRFVKIALFDFCDTMVNFQTADVFVEYALKKLNKNWIYDRLVASTVIENYLNKHWKIKKKLLLYCLKGVRKDELQELAENYCMKILEPATYSYMLDEVKKLKNDGYHILFVSGGYDIYLQCFANMHCVDGVIATKLLFKNDVFSGRIDGTDCMGENKIVHLCDYLKRHNIKVDYSVAYSDSISDECMLKWADRAIVISKREHEKWVTEKKFDEIIISKIEEKRIISNLIGAIMNTGEKVYIYGAGRFGSGHVYRFVTNICNKKVEKYIDAGKAGTTVNNVSVVGMREIEQLDKARLIVVALKNGAEEVVARLRGEGFFNLVVINNEETELLNQIANYIKDNGSLKVKKFFRKIENL